MDAKAGEETARRARRRALREQNTVSAPASPSRSDHGHGVG
jgi:hypothetical protein